MKRTHTKSTKKPDYLVKAVKHVDGKDRWTHIGIAYMNAQGFVTVYLSALPLNDTIILIPVNR